MPFGKKRRKAYRKHPIAIDAADYWADNKRFVTIRGSDGLRKQQTAINIIKKRNGIPRYLIPLFDRRGPVEVIRPHVRVRFGRHRAFAVTITSRKEAFKNDSAVD